MKLLYYIRRFWQIPKIEKILFIKGFIMSFYIHFIIHALPLKTYVKLLKSNAVQSLDKDDFYSSVKLVHKSIHRIIRLSPWQCTCLNKVLTSKYLYKSFGIKSEINLSIFENPTGIKCAHASLLIENGYHYLERIKDFKLVKF